MSKEILIYTGIGTETLCSQSLEAQMLNLINPNEFRVRQITNFGEMSVYSQISSVAALFIPGGNATNLFADSDLLACSKQIKDSMEGHKISFYGSCAGAIVASSKMHAVFRTNDCGNIFLKRADTCLNLFPGSVLAPILQSRSFRPSAADFILADIEQERIKTSVAHILGPGFLDVSHTKGAKELSFYTNLPRLSFSDLAPGKEIPIEKHRISESVFYESVFGNRMVLTGSHPEIGSAEVLNNRMLSFNATTEEVNRIAEILQPSDKERKNILRSHFKMLGLSCMEITN